MTRPTIAKIEGPKSSIRRRIREGESGRPVSGDKEGGAGRRVSADGDDSSPLSAEADSRRMSHGGGGRSSAIRALTFGAEARASILGGNARAPYAPSKGISARPSGTEAVVP
jgi:hypothetical protein